MMPLDIRAICFIFGLILCGALTVSGNAMDIIIDDEEVQGEWIILLKFHALRILVILNIYYIIS